MQTNLDLNNPTHRAALKRLQDKGVLVSLSKPTVKALGKCVRKLRWTATEFLTAARRGRQIMAEMQALSPTDPRFSALNEELKAVTATLNRVRDVAQRATPEALQVKAQVEKELQ